MAHLARRTMLAAAVAGLLSSSVSVAISGAASAAPRPAASCTIRTLPSPADLYRAEATAVDPTSRFMAGTGLRLGEDVGDHDLLLLVWERGRLTTVESPLADSVADVNSRGVVVGNGWIDGQLSPWTYRNGKIERLPTPAGYAGVSAINEAGDIVGAGTEAGTGRQVALRWPAARPGTVEVLDVPAGSFTAGITRNGTIVGTAGDWESARWSAWVRYPDGRVETLTVPGAQSVHVDAAEGRWAVGRAYFDDGSQFKVRWNLRDGSWSRLADGLSSVVDVNARGVVVADDQVVRGTSSQVLPGAAEQVNVGTRAIADTGTIVGFRRDRNNDDRTITPVSWTGC